MGCIYVRPSICIGWSRCYSSETQKLQQFLTHGRFDTFRFQGYSVLKPIIISLFCSHSRSFNRYNKSKFWCLNGLKLQTRLLSLTKITSKPKLFYSVWPNFSLPSWGRCLLWRYHNPLMLLLHPINVLSGPQQLSFALTITQTHKLTQLQRSPLLLLSQCVSSSSFQLPCWGKRGLDWQEERRQWGCDTTMAGSNFRLMQMNEKHHRHGRNDLTNIPCRGKHVTSSAKGLLQGACLIMD